MRQEYRTLDHPEHDLKQAKSPLGVREPANGGQEGPSLVDAATQEAPRTTHRTQQEHPKA